MINRGIYYCIEPNQTKANQPKKWLRDLHVTTFTFNKFNHVSLYLKFKKKKKINVSITLKFIYNYI